MDFLFLHKHIFTINKLIHFNKYMSKKNPLLVKIKNQYQYLIIKHIKTNCLFLTLNPIRLFHLFASSSRRCIFFKIVNYTRKTAIFKRFIYTLLSEMVHTYIVSLVNSSTVVTFNSTAFTRRQVMLDECVVICLINLSFFVYE